MASTHASMAMKTSTASVGAPASDKTAAAPDLAVKSKDGTEEEWQGLPPEYQTVNILPHWEAKPCVRITGLGGTVSEEELLTLLGSHGSVSSIVFENETNDSAIIRFEHSVVKAEDVATRVIDALNDTQFNNITMAVESYRSDSLLFVGNLIHDVDDAQLRSMFEAHGTIERAFVLRNAEGQSKGYGFVEYSLKSQASVAKIALGTLNIDGRVLRVEWSDCRRVSDMFSSVLFIDRIPKDSQNAESILRQVFGKYGKVKDCHLVVGVNQQLRGFGFIDFYHSKYADRAHRALDGYRVNGFSLRVSFANPSKSVQSYKSRFDNSVLQGGRGFGAFRGALGFPFFGQRFPGPGHQGMPGMGFNMAIIAQLLGMNPFDPAFQGAIGHDSYADGIAPETSGLVPFPSSMSSQEQSHKAAVASYNKPSDSYYGYGQPYERAAHDGQANADSQYPYYQSEQQYSQSQTQYPHDNYYLQQPSSQGQSHESAVAAYYKASDSYYGYGQSYERAEHDAQANSESQYQYAQDGYYQQQPSSQLAHSSLQQHSYGQENGQDYGQEQVQQQLYGQTTPVYPQQYDQTTQYPSQQYAQTYVNYDSQPPQQQSLSHDQTSQIASANASLGSGSYGAAPQYQESSNFQYYASTNEGVASQATATTTQSIGTGSSEQSLEAQWAAYYAAQAASEHSQAATAGVGQKRTAYQMDSGSQSTYACQQVPASDYSYPQQNSSTYNYQQQTSPPTFKYLLPGTSDGSGYQQPSQSTQQPSQSVPGYHQPTAANTAYQEHAVADYAPVYQQQAVAAPATSAHSQAVHQLPVAASASPQQPWQNSSSAMSYFDYSKRPRF